MANYKPLIDYNMGGVTRSIPRDATHKILYYPVQGSATVKSLLDIDTQSAYQTPPGTKFIGLGVKLHQVTSLAILQIGKSVTIDTLSTVKLTIASTCGAGVETFSCNFEIDGSKYIAYDTNSSTVLEYIEVFGYQVSA